MNPTNPIALPEVSDRIPAHRTGLGRYPVVRRVDVRYTDTDGEGRLSDVAAAAMHQEASMELTAQAYPSVLEVSQPGEGGAPRISRCVSHTLSTIYNPVSVTRVAGLVDLSPTVFIVGTALFFGDTCLSVCDTVFEVDATESTETMTGDAQEMLRRFRFESAEHAGLVGEK